MKWHKHKEKLITALFFLLFVFTIAQITIYFFYIYKPASQIIGSSKSNYLEIPAVSQLLETKHISTPTLSLADLSKKFYPENIAGFTNKLEEEIGNNSTFVKNSEISYVIGGKVVAVENKDDGVLIRLTNSTKQKVSIAFNQEDMKSIRTSLMILSPSSPTITQINITDVKEEDYLLIKYSKDLLQESLFNKTEAEVYRTPKNSSN